MRRILAAEEGRRRVRSEGEIVLPFKGSLLCGVALVALAAAAPLRAQDAIRILVGFPPGGGADLIARLAADKARDALGAQVIVENRPGIGGQIPAGVDVLSEAIPQHRAGKVRILASSGAKRSPIASEVPTFTELGYPQIQRDGWFAFHAPARTPKATLDRLSSAFGGAMRASDVTERLLKIGFEPVGSSSEELARRMAEDRARWAPIVRASGFSVDQ